MLCYTLGQRFNFCPLIALFLKSQMFGFSRLMIWKLIIKSFIFGQKLYFVPVCCKKHIGKLFLKHILIEKVLPLAFTISYHGPSYFTFLRSRKVEKQKNAAKLVMHKWKKGVKTSNTFALCA